MRKTLIITLTIIVSLLLGQFSIAGEELIFKTKTIKEENTIKLKQGKTKYTVNISYPLLDGYKDSVIQKKFNTNISSLIVKELENFKKTVKEVAISDPQFSSEFSITSQIIHKANNIASIKLDNYIYIAGSAHPSDTIFTINYDLKKGVPLKFGDLFIKDSNYMKIVSDYCINDLKEQEKKEGIEPDMNWITDGAGPKEENYKTFNITKNGLTVTFNQYQVAPYAAGIKVVNIPYSVLKKVIDKTGPVGIYIK